MVNFQHIGKNQISNLLVGAKNSPTGISRICLHPKSYKKIQLMVIAFAPHTIYEFAKDKVEGLMLYTCIFGELEIELIDLELSKKTKINLRETESLRINRSYFRKTKSGSKGAIFIESIEGAHYRELRERL